VREYLASTRKRRVTAESGEPQGQHPSGRRGGGR